MTDINISGLRGQLSAKTGKSTAAAAEKKEDFLALLKERITERRAIAEEAIRGGRSIQQQALGISDEEWARLDLAHSPLLQPDKEKDDDDKSSATGTSDRNGDSVSSDDTETISRVLGDGTTLIVTTRGNRVIATQKIAPDEITVANPIYVAPEDGGIGAAARKTVTKKVAHMDLF
ncbi:hypothetical protein TAMA11512_03490 [Selenomonas sp. TAMA-11512]|uniref:hypothetical protein n=1 Tax=Selenomonas sp. TAMA-11512 TaxID=3095337 RepID=UPI0030902F0B|nr:hypothetical protein TAMA11512_03490 [Selenomonas sp. TAMA-11512]